MTRRKFKLFSFFSGCGMLDLGFEHAGFEISFVNEYFAPFLEAYQFARQKMRMPIHPVYGCWDSDIDLFLGPYQERLHAFIEDARQDGSLLGFVGGPPCPDFSIAGKQKGQDGEHGRLSRSYVDLIIKMQPDFFVFENVKGLWKTTRHRKFFEDLKSDLSQAGYAMTERLCNALEFGVPQDRDRIILVGIKRKLLLATSMDSGTIVDFPWDKYRRYDCASIKSMPWPDTSPFSGDSAVLPPPNILCELTVQHWFETNHVDKHPNRSDFFQPRAGLAKMRSIQEGDVSRKSYKRLHRYRYSPTVAYGNNEVHLHPYKARRLSVAEALSLQSAPESFALPADMTLSNKFKTVGNAVPYLLAFGVAQTLRDYLNMLIE